MDNGYGRQGGIGVKASTGDGRLRTLHAHRGMDDGVRSNLKIRRIGHFAGCKRVSVSLWVILQAGRDTPLKTSSFGIA